MKLADVIERKKDEIPSRPGVYVFKNRKGTPLYIGKAKDLKTRLNNYRTQSGDPRIRVVQRQATDLECIVTDSEAEAMLLEANLIKVQKPRFNIRLKDDKKYPYLKVTLGEPYPRIYPTRDLRDDGSAFFGPYTNAKAMRRALRTVRTLFPIRTCKYKLKAGRRIQPCIDYYIGKCAGPCHVDMDESEYALIVGHVMDFLAGKTDRLEDKLEKEMARASRNLEFERATRLRNQLMAVRETLSGVKAIAGDVEDKDVVAVARSGGLALGLIFYVRDGEIAGKGEFVLDVDEETVETELSQAFLSQIYTTATIGARTLVVQVLPEDARVLRDVIRERSGRRVKIRKPHSDEAKLMKLAARNAERALLLEVQSRVRRDRGAHPAVHALEDLLALDRPPVRIEAVDISQLFGGQAVGSIIAFQNGQRRKSDYRRFRIRSTRGMNDVGMIEEVVKRRFKRLRDEDADFPDLLLVDGGIGQLNAARKAMDSLGVRDVPLAALAKRLDELYLEGGIRLMLPRRSPALKLLQRIRDEAHRFAITYHRSLRAKEGKASFLDTLPGVGEKRKLALIGYFGSLKRLLSASPEEIAKTPGIGPGLSLKIYEYLHGD
jgi:excinuclease ABC subunit C